MARQQLHKRLSDEHVKFILTQYEAKEITAKEASVKLNLGRTRFYQIVHDYQNDPDNFKLEYNRTKVTRKIDLAIEKNILKELKIEKEKIIDDPDVPTTRYNYSYIQKLLQNDYDQKVSVNTIINRAKDNDYYKDKLPKKTHDREVLTDYVGELIQHDSSHHLFAPDGDVKWYLITSLDDYSRKILYADLWIHESSFAHILALQNVVLRYGVPYAYYTDQHRIFRYVKSRDNQTCWTNYSKFTDDVDPQWKQVLKDLKIKPTYALSPQAKGKIERPYQWMQDHLVRTCVRQNITDINDGRKILKQEVNDYNNKRVHSTTKEIPSIRFNRAIKENKSLLTPFKLEPPFQSVKDIFCLRETRIANAYKKISFCNLSFTLPKAEDGQKIELRIYPDEQSKTTEIRFWNKANKTFIGAKTVKNDDLPIVQF